MSFALSDPRRSIQPMPLSHYDLGNDLLLKGQIDAAIVEYRKALAAEPGLVEAMQNLGVALRAKGEYQEAELLLRQAIAARPSLVLPYTNLGAMLASTNRLDEAIAMYRQALRLDPNLVASMNNLGESLHQAGRSREAVDLLRVADRLAADTPEILCNLGRSLAKTGLLDEAISALKRCIELRPTMIQALGNLGGAYRDAGDVSAAIATYRTAMQIAPQNASMHSNLIFAMLYDPQIDDESLSREQRRWNDLHAAPYRASIKPLRNERSPDRKLRIGYVSPYFYFQAEAFFVVPLLENHDHQQFEIHCYSDVIAPDWVTQRLAKCADRWHDVKSMNATALAEKIRGDGIDILIDLTMHMGRNRLTTFAQKPAPLQIAWLAYPGGTGLDSMDYRFTDAHMDPPGATSHYHERPIVLPDCWCCYDPLCDAPTPASRQDGPIRFASLNHPCKHNDATLITWAKVLRNVADSRLTILSVSESDHSRIRSVLEQNGVAPDRIEFTGRKNREEYLRLYSSIDIGLDPLPYSGITTSCDALWMGVPVVTLRGNTVAGRAGANILSAVGLPDLIAETEEQFVQIATDLAHNQPRLAKLRSILRSQMRQSPLGDGKRFAKTMETAYRQVWLEHVAER